MKKQILYVTVFILILNLTNCNQDACMNELTFKPFTPPIGYEVAGQRADTILSKMTLEEKIEFVGGHNLFFINGYEKYDIPKLYLSDATQGVHIRSDLSNAMEKSVAFPNPLALTATWNTELAHNYAKSIGEECRAGDIAVLLGPGMNIYRISQNGRNFEYFGEDSFLASRMIENYVTGVQGTGTIATLKHFVANNNEHHRRTTNAVLDERTLHEIYMPAFKAGIDAGAMAIMTAYNQVNGEWAGQSEYVITELLRNQLGFKWLVMSDWWSTWDAVKTIKSGLDLEMPGDTLNKFKVFQDRGDITVKTNAKNLIDEGKVNEADVDRMALNILRTQIAMGLHDRPVKDEKLFNNFDKHEKVALETARQSIVLLKNANNILPLKEKKQILLTGKFVEELPKGGGSAAVEGYSIITMLDAFSKEFGDNLEYIINPTDEQVKAADAVILSTGTIDSEGWDRPFKLPEDEENNIIRITGLNPNTVIIVNSGSSIRMTDWNDKAAAIIYAWYPGQNGNTALAEVLAGKVNPSGKLPMTIEKEFEDSPGYNYIPEGTDLATDWDDDIDMEYPINDVEYDEGVLVGYRWYDTKGIQPLYHFGHGLSYSEFEYDGLDVSDNEIKQGDKVFIEFSISNTGKVAGAETAQLYVRDLESSVIRPVKELKGFRKVFLNPGENKTIKLVLSEKDFSYWDENIKDWKAEPGEFELLIGSASDDIRLKTMIKLI